MFNHVASASITVQKQTYTYTSQYCSLTCSAAVHVDEQVVAKVFIQLLGKGMIPICLFMRYIAILVACPRVKFI